MARRIILLLDGTWNDADVGPFDTNIVRLREIIARSLDSSSSVTQSESPAAENSTAKLVSGRTYQGQTEHLVFYERGVGTGPLLDRIKGGSFGDGLSGNIRRAYKFLSFYYEPGDQIFVFGFSCLVPVSTSSCRSPFAPLQTVALQRPDGAKQLSDMIVTRNQSGR